YNYNKTLNEAAAWIDYYTIAVPRKLGVYESQQIIRTDRLELDGMIKYPIEGLGSDHLVWNISNKYVPANQETYTDGSLQSFISEDTTALAPLYIIFDKDDAPSPTYVKKVASQNLHQLSGIDYIMISHPSLVSEAERLSEFHKARGLDVAVVTTEEVFNEFSSGSQDVTGIRDFIKLIYDRGQQSGDTLRYVLMFGDGSYDYKDVEANNTNLVPIYQSYNSNDPTHSYCSDDYYAILSDSEGYWGTSNKDEDLDIFIGRLPVSNEAEAKIVVDKILHYHSPASRGNWMQTLTFVADDENSNAHIQPSENMVDTIQKQSSEYNIKKIWLDAYKQVSFGSGNKFPEVNEEITKMIGSQGTLIFNYVGHGGENGMAHERVVTRPEIQSWTNYDKLAFYITASCELAKI
ncbi:MAG: C25 family cysteine peptidase, partial [Bacteroidia bacterium]